MTGTDVVDWPAVRDVVAEVGVSQPWVWNLIHDGRLHAVRTRLGWLVDPASVAAYKTERAARLRQQKQRSA